jgi:hypothetical protein
MPYYFFRDFFASSVSSTASSEVATDVAVLIKGSTIKFEVRIAQPHPSNLVGLLNYFVRSFVHTPLPKRETGPNGKGVEQT